MSDSKRYHVMVRPESVTSPGDKSDVLERILKAAGTKEYNSKRYDRYGIVTVDTDDSEALEALRRDPAVEDIEADEVKRAT